VALAAVLLVAVATLAAGRLAASIWRAPFTGLLLDPYGSFSVIHLPSWGERVPLRFPDHLVAIDGRAVPRDPAAPNASVLPAVFRMVEERRLAGVTSVELEFESRGAPVVFRRPIRQIGAEELGFLFGFYTVVGWAVLISGVVVYLAANRREAARAYGLWSVGLSLFFCTFFDYHTTAALTPLFGAGAMCAMFGWLWLAWAFPEPPRGAPRVVRFALRAAAAFCVVAGVLLALAGWLPADLRPLRVAVSDASSVCPLVLAVALAGKLRTASGEARAQLRATLHGLVTVPVLVGLGFFLLIVVGSSIIHLLLPLLAPAIPFAIAYAIIRHDVLHTHAVLPSRLLLVPLAFLGCAAGLLVWLVLRYVGLRSGMDWLIPAMVGVLSAALLVIAGHKLFVRMFFPAVEQYRPTIEQLSERFATLHDEEPIRAELSRLARRWLPVDRAEVLPGDALDRLEVLSLADRGALRLGRTVRLDGQMFLPLRFQGEVCGLFQLGRKSGGALFTSEDLGLLETMAALGAVALHHAAALREVESLRKAQVKASREERSRVVDTLSAEIAHELGHPLRYFKALFEERPADASLTDEEVSFARLQVDRMDRMRSTLETMEIAPPRKDPVALWKPVEHAILLLREPLQSSQIRPRVEVAPDLVVKAEHDPLVQVFANLLRNAAQAAGLDGRVGVRAARSGDGLIIDIWDDGPGIAEDLRDTLFRVWGVTTRREGKGLGLMVVSRVLCHLHWHVDFLRVGDLTVFRITIPAADVVCS
jgi:two-component system sensor histidine kinase KdpD